VQALLPNANLLLAQNTNYAIPSASLDADHFCLRLRSKNKLPYSENWTLDLQWQPKNDIVFTLGYVGNHGFHETIPLRFNQAQIATPQHPLLVGGLSSKTIRMDTVCRELSGKSSGADGWLLLRATLLCELLTLVTIPTRTYYKAVGISSYSALQFNVTKRMSHGLQISGSYTYSHTLDEQSALGLFYNGNDPNNTRSSYGTPTLTGRTFGPWSITTNCLREPRAHGGKNN